jgi:hypothetical protein
MATIFVIYLISDISLSILKQQSEQIVLGGNSFESSHQVFTWDSSAIQMIWKVHPSTNHTKGNAQCNLCSMYPVTEVAQRGCKGNQFASSDNQKVGINTVRGCGCDFNQVSV